MIMVKYSLWQDPYQQMKHFNIFDDMIGAIQDGKFKMISLSESDTRTFAYMNIKW